MRGGLFVWIAKRVPWKLFDHRFVTVNGIEYVRKDIVEKLLKERDTLARKHSRERKRRGEVENELRALKGAR